MSFLFATVELFLFFFGRSTGVSVTSTTTTSSLSLDCRSFFLPGRVKALELTRLSSIFLTILYAVDSFTPHVCPIGKYVRYSLQYSKVINNWFSLLNLLGLPGGFCNSICSKTDIIASKVFGCTP